MLCTGEGKKDDRRKKADEENRRYRVETTETKKTTYTEKWRYTVNIVEVNRNTLYMYSNTVQCIVLHCQ